MELNKIINSDCVEGMRRVESESVDLIISDPPYYKIVKEKWDNQWNTEKDYIDWCLEWTKESFRVLREGGLLYVWGGIGKHKEHPFIKYLLRVEEETEFKFLNFITMENFRVFGNARHFPFARQELLVFSKGKHSTYNKQYSDFEGTNKMGKPKLVSNVWVDCKDVSLYNKKDSHPTEKPYLSSERIVLSSTNEGDTVLIPFVGSGVDCEACKNNNRNYIGFEIDNTYFKNSLKRVNSQ